MLLQSTVGKGDTQQFISMLNREWPYVREKMLEQLKVITVNSEFCCGIMEDFFLLKNFFEVYLLTPLKLVVDTYYIKGCNALLGCHGNHEIFISLKWVLISPFQR